MKEVIIGLDIGIASVGWCVTDKKDNSIVKHGVRLFNTVDNEKDSKLLNETRREKRSSRRQLNRKKVLKRDFIKFLIENNYIDGIEIKDKNDNSFVNEFRNKYLIPMDKRMNKEFNKEGIYWIHILRKKSLTEKIEFKQLISVLYWYLTNRGFKYTVKGEKNEFKNKNTIKLKNEDKKDKYPIDLLLESYKETKKTKDFFNRNFHKDDYLRELKQIFIVQETDQKLVDAFINEKIKNEEKPWENIGFFNRQRTFEIGPGGENTPTKYGLYMKNKDGKIEKLWTNIWEKTIGKCSYYIDEFRAPKNSFSAQIFNLLNDLNNLSWGNKEKLETKDKLNILKLAIIKKFGPSKVEKYIKDTYEIDKDQIKGFRIDSSKKILITTLKSYIDIQDHFEKYIDLSLNFETITGFTNSIKNNKIDKIIDVCNKSKIVEKRNDEIAKMFNINHDDEFVGKCNEIYKKINASQNHSLSYKALNKFIPELLDLTDNYSTLSYEWRINNNLLQNNSKYLKVEWINDVITSPTVKRSLHQTTNIINALIKESTRNDWNITNIVVEMTRSTNNKAVREQITGSNKYFENVNKEVKKLIGEHSYSNGKGGKRVGIFRKVKFLIEQDHFDAYDGKEIKLEDLKKNPQNYDIDHILPQSKSFDNSSSNLVLTKNIHNSNKGNKTPKQWMPFNDFIDITSKWREWYLNPKNDKFNRKKYDNLTSIVDFNDPTQQLGFINRNLTDTSYTTSEFLKILINHFKDTETKIQTINGRMTSFARGFIERLEGNLLRPEDSGDSRDEKGKKNRIWHGHHAEDAYLITLLIKNYAGSKFIEKHVWKDDKNIDNMLSDPTKYDWVKKLDNFKEILTFGKKELNLNMEKLKFSRKLEIKTQKSATAEKLTGLHIECDKKNKKVAFEFKYLKLIELEEKKCKSLFSSSAKDKEKIFLYHENKELYNELCSIYEENKKNKLPFKSYLDDYNEENNCKYNNNIHVQYRSKTGKDITLIINKIKVKGAKKDLVDIFKGNKDNGGSFYNSLEWLRLDIYKNKKGKYQIVPITIKLVKFGDFKKQKDMIINEDALTLFKQKYKIPLENKKLFCLNKYDIILKDGIEYFIVGHSYKRNKIELKILHKNMDKDEERMRKPINKFLINTILVKKDVLGKIISKTQIFIV